MHCVIGSGDHFFVEFLARPNANHRTLALGADGFGHVGGAVAGNFRRKQFTAPLVWARRGFCPDGGIALSIRQA
jgi:hypothetical protein